ncbi:branched-chain amino acid ABC transporter substrate-binding protein [Streptomyces sp. N35]|uniref:branched-chain amino acid ABC transporter substrate-binding protein n=1 Tax=Streptomyces sp. N35 TaxID=2795730 RepID=UPI0018F5F2CA|nr:branched-chain amino acid ABC transporter substrate-binding protein [Streptomyces sp. N35]
MSHHRTPRRLLCLSALAVACVLTSSSCDAGLLADDVGNKDEGPILLGMAVPRSGSTAEVGPYMSNAAQLAVDEINAQGGVLGRKLKLQVEDEACDPKTATAAANKLVSAGVKVSVGGYCSGATLPTLPIFDRHRIPMIIPAANSSELVDQRLKHVFLINGTGRQQSAAALEWLGKEGAEKVAVLHDNTSYSKDIGVRTEAGLDKAGGPEASGLHAITPGESDYGPAVTSVLKDKPDYVFFTGYYQEGGLLIKQFRQAGYKGKFLGADGLVDPKLARIAGDAEGVHATMTQTPDTLPQAKGWIAAYKKKFKADPGPYSTQSYDAVRLAAEAIEQAGSTDGGAIVKALEAVDGFQLFSGPLKFTPEHTLSNGGFVILVNKGGRFVLKDNLQ